MGFDCRTQHVVLQKTTHGVTCIARHVRCGDQVTWDKAARIPCLEKTDVVWEHFKSRAVQEGLHMRSIAHIPAPTSRPASRNYAGTVEGTTCRSPQGTSSTCERDTSRVDQTAFHQGRESSQEAGTDRNPCGSIGTESTWVPGYQGSLPRPTGASGKGLNPKSISVEASNGSSGPTCGTCHARALGMCLEGGPDEASLPQGKNDVMIVAFSRSTAALAGLPDFPGS